MEEIQKRWIFTEYHNLDSSTSMLDYQELVFISEEEWLKQIKSGKIQLEMMEEIGHSSAFEIKINSDKSYSMTWAESGLAPDDGVDGSSFTYEGTWRVERDTLAFVYKSRKYETFGSGLPPTFRAYNDPWLNAKAKFHIENGYLTLNLIREK